MDKPDVFAQERTGTVSLERFATDVAAHSWSKNRRFLSSIISSKRFEFALGLLVLLSLVLAIIQTEKKAHGDETPSWIAPVEYVLVVLYSCEMMSRIFVLREQFFESYLHVLDLLIVVVDVVFTFVRLAGVELPQVTFLRTFRLTKLTRAFHILSSQQQLALFAEAFMASLKTLVFGSVFISVSLLIFAIIAVEFLYPLKPNFSETCTRCPEGFSSVYEAMVTLLQTVIAGDEWAEVFRPFLAEYPVTIIYIVPVFISVNFGLMNLIVAVIVDTASQARIANTRRVAEMKEQEFRRNEKRLYGICAEMDSDRSGNISLAELREGFDTHLEFRRTLNAMDVRKEDLEAVFSILDGDDSGDIQYAEFVEQLHKMRSNDSHTMLVFIKHYVTDLRKKMSEELVVMKGHIAGGITQLHDRVNEELELIKSNMDYNIQALQAADKRLEEAFKHEEEVLKEEEKLLKDDMQLHRQALDAPFPMTPFSAVGTSDAKAAASIPHESLAAWAQLQNASDQIYASLEDLKRSCEKSAEKSGTLLATFSGSALASNTRQMGPSMRTTGSAFDRIAQGDNSRPAFWKSEACCSTLQVSKPGVPSATDRAGEISQHLLTKPSFAN